MKFQTKDNRIKRNHLSVFPTDVFKLCSPTQQTVQAEDLRASHFNYSSGDPEELLLSRIPQFRREDQGFSKEHCHFFF